MESTAQKVGELARRAGLTVRTLHHYDEIGLLSPSRRSPAGHRLYGTAEIMRLQQIRSLQHLGFSLDEIGALLDDEQVSPRRVVRMHLARLRQQLERQAELVDRLQEIAEHMDGAEEVSADLFLKTIEAMTMFDKYYTPEQQQYLKERRETVGGERIREVQAEWQQLYAGAQTELEKGTDPADEAVQKLVRKSRDLLAEFTGGDTGIRASLQSMWRQEPSVRRQWGPPPAVAEYLEKAAEAGGRDE